MKFLNTKTLATLGLLALSPLAANAASVTIDTTTNHSSSTASSLTLDAGTYIISTTSGAWNAWGNPNFGWLNTFTVEVPSISTFNVGDSVKYTSEAAAFANALTGYLTLAATTDVKFYVNDTYFTDNIGSMDLAVTAVPVPAAALLFAPAALGFVGLRRKAKKATV